MEQTFLHPSPPPSFFSTLIITFSTVHCVAPLQAIPQRVAVLIGPRYIYCCLVLRSVLFLCDSEFRVLDPVCHFLLPRVLLLPLFTSILSSGGSGDGCTQKYMQPKNKCVCTRTENINHPPRIFLTFLFFLLAISFSSFGPPFLKHLPRTIL